MNIEKEKLELPELKFSYTALEPVLVSEILEVHHKKHHNKYVSNYNDLTDKVLPALSKNRTHEVQKLLPKLHFNAGGHNCHAMYWENLAPSDNGGGVLPDEKSLLTKAIVSTWGSYDNFMEDFNGQTGSI